MEDTTLNGEQLSLINELIQGKELAKQLCNHLVSSSSSPTHQSSSQDETDEFLIEKILSTYDRALTMLNWAANNVGDTKNTNTTIMTSNCSSTNGTPRSDHEEDDMDEEFKHKPAFKKRKTMPGWTEQVKICSKTGLEGSLDDGYSWRKYGQKDILGAKFPRGYYRCTHRNVQGCLATKQVQKSDEDPTIIEVTYRGRHTCIQAKAKHSHKAFPSKPKMCLEQNQLIHKHQNNQSQQQKNIEQPPEAIFTFEEVKLEELDTETKEDIFPWYCFISPSIGSENEDNNILSDHFMESFSHNEFISPETSESNIFCVSPCYLSSSGLVQNVQTSESDITEIISAPTSVTNSPIMDLDILLGKGDFDTDFPCNTPEYLCS